MQLKANVTLEPGVITDLFNKTGLALGTKARLTLITDRQVRVYISKLEPSGDSGYFDLMSKSDSITLSDGANGCWVVASFGAEINFSENFTDSSGDAPISKEQIIIDGNETKILETDDTITSIYDPSTNTTSFSAIPTPYAGVRVVPLVAVKYNDFNNIAWATVIADNSVGDIAYFSQEGLGTEFANLPSSIVLNAENTYKIDSEVTELNGFAQRLSIASSEPTDDMNNRTLQRAGESFIEGRDQWAEVTLKRDAVVYDDKTVALPKVFKTIITGPGISGEVIDDVLELTSDDDYIYNFTTSFYSLAIQDTPINRAIYVSSATHFRKSLMSYDASINGVCIESGAEGELLMVAVRGVFPTGNLSLNDINPGDLIYIDNVTGILNWYALVDLGSHPCGWYAGDGKMWVDIDMYNRYRSVYGLAKLNDNVAFESVTTNSVTGTAVGRTVIQNAGIIKRNNSTDSNSISFDAGTLNYRSDSHSYKANGGKLLFEFNNENFNTLNKPIANLKAANTDDEAVNLGQAKEVSNSITQARMAFTGGTLYAHNHDHNMFINYQGSGKEIALDTMREGTEQQSDSAIIYNDGYESVTVRLFYDGQSTPVVVPIGYTLSGWANRIIGKWVYYLAASPSGVNQSRSLSIFNMAVESQNKYGTQLVVDLRGEQNAIENQ